VEGNTIGTATDLDGAFSIAGVPAGPHARRLSSVGYTGKTVPGLAVATGKVVVVNTFLSSSNAALAEVVVTAQRRTTTEIAVISEVRNAQLVAVGVSSEQIVKS